jgi:hypothetical protein
LAVIAARRRREDCVWWAFPAAYYLAVAGSRVVFVRHALPLVPLLAAWGAVCIAEVHRRWGRGWASAVMLAAAAPSFVRAAQFDALMSQPDTRTLAAQWLAGRLDPGETVGWIGPHWTVPVLQTKPASEPGQEPLAKVLLLNSCAEPPARAPRWIVSSRYAPLAHYCRHPAWIGPWLAGRYARVVEWQPLGVESIRSVYDVQDAFFAPFAGFAGVSRPGPGLTVYRLGEGL